jgi:hypothetical protein
MNLSNGTSSPLFKGSDNNDLSEVKTLYIWDISKVKRVQGTNSFTRIRSLIFKTAGGAEVGRMEGSNTYLRPDDAMLSEGEEVIGVYGQYNDSLDSRIGKLGLLVWRPNEI